MTDCRIIIERDEDQTIETKGNFHIDTGSQILFSCVCLEPPNLNDDGIEGNEKGKSCIKADVYEWVKVGPTAAIPYVHIAILNVPGRSGVCIHYGNLAAGKRVHTKGCVLVGKSYADINGDGIDDITTSKVTFEKIMELLPDSGKLIFL